MSAETTSTGDEPEESEKPARRKKRKKATTPKTPTKRKKAKTPIERTAAALDESGNERPAFLLKFPKNDELDRLVAAFERGDYNTVRSDAPALAEKSEDASVRDAALELRRRIDPDPLAKYLLWASMALLTFLVLWTYLGHEH